MHCAMQDQRYIYFLMDLLPGGELMDLLERKGSLPEEWIKFYAASVRPVLKQRLTMFHILMPPVQLQVLVAYNEFHAQRICYRDLKPGKEVLHCFVC